MNDFGSGQTGRPDITAGQVDPDYFSLRVRQALQGADEPSEYLDDPLDGVVGPEDGELLAEKFVPLAGHPEVVVAGVAVVEAEAAVMAAEDAGVTDELAMRRLDRARAAERAVLVRLQRQRAVAHTRRAVSRVAQVVPVRRFVVVEGGAAA